MASTQTTLPPADSSVSLNDAAACPCPLTTPLPFPQKTRRPPPIRLWRWTRRQLTKTLRATCRPCHLPKRMRRKIRDGPGAVRDEGRRLRCGNPWWTLWLTLEHATSFQTSGKALSTTGRPAAVSWWVQRGRNTTRIPMGLDDEDECEDFYAAVVLWWVSVNPVWRKEGVTTVEDFEARGLKQSDEGDLTALPQG
ncbi:hypothetical protein B0H14DRAFT_2617032 [Mycena olivaceomarginata]|nr:hypothetical protein B0H14DRAFT_2617032 [Mycena olivaceomarginata]